MTLPAGSATAVRFFRDKTGRTVHLAGCKVRGHRVPWLWANDRSDHVVATTILATPWLRPCTRCCGVLRDAL